MDPMNFMQVFVLYMHFSGESIKSFIIFSKGMCQPKGISPAGDEKYVSVWRRSVCVKSDYIGAHTGEPLEIGAKRNKKKKAPAAWLLLKRGNSEIMKKKPMRFHPQFYRVLCGFNI